VPNTHTRQSVQVRGCCDRRANMLGTPTKAVMQERLNKRSSADRHRSDRKKTSADTALGRTEAMLTAIMCDQGNCYERKVPRPQISTEYVGRALPKQAAATSCSRGKSTGTRSMKDGKPCSRIDGD